MEHLEISNILYFDMGFDRPVPVKHSSFLSYKIYPGQSVNQYIQTDVIIMHIAKAFDKVSHRQLLYKLSYAE